VLAQPHVNRVLDDVEIRDNALPRDHEAGALVHFLGVHLPGLQVVR
jgi:hypothetical protein